MAQTLDWSARADLIGAAAAVAVLASFTLLSLVRGQACAGRGARLRRQFSAALALATGALSSLFIVLSGQALPTSAAFGVPILVAAFALAVAAGLGALPFVPQASRVWRWGVAGALSAALCGASLLALHSLAVEPQIGWRAAPVAAAWILGALGIGAALSPPFVTPAGAGRQRSTLAALLLGVTLAAVNVALLSAVEIAANAAVNPNASGLISNILTQRSAAPINCRRVIPFFGVDDDDPGKVIPPALSCGVRREWAPRGDLAAQSAHASTLVAGVRQGSAPPPPTAAAPR